MHAHTYCTNPKEFIHVHIVAYTLHYFSNSLLALFTPFQYISEALLKRKSLASPRFP